MNSRYLIPQAINFVVYILLQVFIVRNLVLFDVAFCFVYIAFLLLLPIEAAAVTCMLLGFATGLVVDIFYNTFGIHAAACVFIMYIRRYWISALTPRGGYDIGMTPSPRAMGLRWFITYAIPLIFVHHATVFFVEIGGFSLFYYTLIKALASTAFTFILVTVIQYIIHTPRRTVL
ncbi:Rod shape-determining protein MreD [Catalinimonas sp. 4WD22]|uniref:Rod shape-determining protein MreD n=1 Tax=Catalinimonas locisalis TaxID=3133978 RepID=UPI003100FD40